MGWCRGQDSNLRSREAAVLQTAGFNHSPTPARAASRRAPPDRRPDRRPACGAREGIRTRQPSDYKSAALPLRHSGSTRPGFLARHRLPDNNHRPRRSGDEPIQYRDALRGRQRGLSSAASPTTRSYCGRVPTSTPATVTLRYRLRPKVLGAVTLRWLLRSSGEVSSDTPYFRGADGGPRWDECRSSLPRSQPMPSSCSP